MNSNTERKAQTLPERNPIELPSVATAEITHTLNEILASLSVQFHNYLKHHWTVEGPLHRDLHQFFDDAYNTSLKHLDAVAERITVLGGTPNSSPRTFVAQSFVEVEGDAELPVRAMLENDLGNEQTIIAKLREAIRLTSELGDFGTENLLKQTLVQREQQAHDLSHYLAADFISASDKA